jgi:hypothetical protein
VVRCRRPVLAMTGCRSAGSCSCGRRGRYQNQVSIPHGTNRAFAMSHLSNIEVSGKLTAVLPKLDITMITEGPPEDERKTRPPDQVVCQAGPRHAGRRAASNRYVGSISPEPTSSMPPMKSGLSHYRLRLVLRSHHISHKRQEAMPPMTWNLVVF